MASREPAAPARALTGSDSGARPDGARGEADGSRARSRVERGADLALAALTLLSVVPLWMIEILPFQDLPQHLAAIRVLASFDDPALAIDRYHVLALTSTPHVAYHLAGALIARVVGVELANRLLMTAVIAATPWTVRALARATGGDGRVGLLVVSVAYGVPVVLGLLPFVAAAPLSIAAVAWAVGLAARPTVRSAIGLSALLVLALATHVVPWALAVLAIALVALPGGNGTESPRLSALRRAGTFALVCLPSIAIAALWLFDSPSGADTRAAFSAIATDPGEAMPASIAATFGDVVTGYVDDAAFFGVLFLAWSGTLVTWTDRSGARHVALRRRVAIAAVVAFALYLFAPRGFDWIWAIHMRFAWMALLLALALARGPSGRAGVAWTVAASVLGLVHLGSVTQQMQAFEADEARGLSRAIDAIPRGSRVVALVYRPTSRHVRFAPMLHTAAWYQARRGGAVMFSFADYPSWPFRFGEHVRPPRVPSRWEYGPHDVHIPDDIDWYDYVLVRAGPGPVSSMPTLFRAVYRDPRWSAWKRLRSSAPR